MVVLVLMIVFVSVAMVVFMVVIVVVAVIMIVTVVVRKVLWCSRRRRLSVLVHARDVCFGACNHPGALAHASGMQRPFSLDAMHGLQSLDHLVQRSSLRISLPQGKTR